MIQFAAVPIHFSKMAIVDTNTKILHSLIKTRVVI